MELKRYDICPIELRSVCTSRYKCSTCACGSKALQICEHCATLRDLYGLETEEDMKNRFPLDYEELKQMIIADKI